MLNLRKIGSAVLSYIVPFVSVIRIIVYDIIIIVKIEINLCIDVPICRPHWFVTQ